jgi:hypothetical protein
VSAARDAVRDARLTLRAAVHHVELAELGLDTPEASTAALALAETRMDAAARMLAYASDELAREEAEGRGRLL